MAISKRSKNGKNGLFWVLFSNWILPGTMQDILFHKIGKLASRDLASAASSMPLRQCSENCESSKIVKVVKSVEYGRDISRGIISWQKSGRVEIGENSTIFWQIIIGEVNKSRSQFQHANPSHFISKSPILHCFCLIFMMLSAALRRYFLGLIWHTYQCVLYTFVVILIPNSP